MSHESWEAKKRRPHRYDAALQGHKLTIAYRGTEFFGWQRQSGKRTVQECLETALGKIWGEKISVQGSGRTDTGVHAHGQVASFNARRLHNATVLLRALNANLPLDVRIVKCRLVSPAFHARFDAKGKTYRYLIWNALVQDPFTLDTHWHVPRPLNLAAMRRAARLLLGRHDFASFTSNPGYKRERGTVRTMRRASITKNGNVLTFHFTSDGFLYRMVRNLAGGLIKVGLGKITVDDFGRILRARSRSAAPETAPACRLCLMNVRYGKDGIEPALFKASHWSHKSYRSHKSHVSRAKRRPGRARDSAQHRRDRPALRRDQLPCFTWWNRSGSGSTTAPWRGPAWITGNTSPGGRGRAGRRWCEAHPGPGSIS